MEQIVNNPKTAIAFLVASLKACARKKDLCQGSKLHAAIRTHGLLENNPCVGSTLVSMYAKCGALAKAQEVHNELPVRGVITWSALIAGCVLQGEGKVALECYDRMQSEGFSPNAITYASVLKACGSTRDVGKGEHVHDKLARQGLLGKDVALDTALVDMYAKCGVLSKAQQVFDEISVRDVVSWSSLIGGYVQQGKGAQALECYKRMRSEGLSPNAFTYALILKACGITKEINKGKDIHNEIASQQLLGKDVVLGTALVDMYSKCGVLMRAQEVLDELPVRNVVSWNALIGGYAHEGKVEKALSCFERMQGEGISPNAVTFLCVLHACRHTGLVDVGQLHYENMKTRYHIAPSLKHNVCMIDLFGCAGQFHRALAIMEKMSSVEHLSIWSSLLGACLKWGNVSIGRMAFEHAIQLDKSDAAAYMCMEKLYAAAGMQADARNVILLRIKNATGKQQGHSWQIGLRFASTRWIDEKNYDVQKNHN